MAFNVPSYSTGRFSFGPGIIYLGAPGATPTVDIGAVRGDAELSVQRSRLEMKQGSPQSLVKSYAIEETITFRCTGVEWDFDNIAYALGAGITSVSGADEILEFGGDQDTSTRALRFLHIQPDGSTVDLHLFKVEGSGELALALKETDFHEFPYAFNVLEGVTDFAGATISNEKKKKFKIIRTPA